MGHFNAQNATMRLNRRALITSFVLLVGIGLILSYTKSSRAQEHPKTPTVHALTAEDLSGFMDGLIPVQMRQNDIAGGVITIVKDGKVLFSRGYGYADVESKKPVSPDDTLFRLASISKLFSCTAVMQLVEQGKLDLDADINQYLDFQIPATFPQPITLRHLMTHTAGFQETIRGTRAADDGRIFPLKEYLPGHLPPRIFAPGTIPAYSNYSTAVAGYIVERATGQSFEDYIEEHIFRPLGMTKSTYKQPLPDLLKPLVSSGYVSAMDPARPFELIQTFPGGGMSSTASDVARYMIAQLQNGGAGDARILKSETAQAMQSRQFGLVPLMNGSAFGFAEQNRNGYRVLGHGGDLQCFHSQVFLVPELQLGFFFSQNSLGRANLRGIIWRSFFDRYFPSSRQIERAEPMSDATEFDGYYKTTRRFDHSIFKLGSLNGQIWVSGNQDGTVRCDLVNELGRPKTLREVAPMKYCDEKGEDCISFRRDEAGRLQLIGDFPHVAFQSVPWYENKTKSYAVLIGSAAVFALTLILWPTAAITRRHYGRTLQLTSSELRRRILVRVVCAIDLAFLIAGRLLMLRLPNPKLEVWVPVIQVVGIVGSIGTLILIYDAIRSWSDPGRWWGSKIGSVIAAIAGLGFVAFALVWHLFDFSNRY